MNGEPGELFVAMHDWSMPPHDAASVLLLLIMSVRPFAYYMRAIGGRSLCFGLTFDRVSIQVKFWDQLIVRLKSAILLTTSGHVAVKSIAMVVVPSTLFRLWIHGHFWVNQLLTRCFGWPI